MLAVYAPAIFFDGLIQKSSLDLFLVCLVLWWIGSLTCRPSAARWLVLGASLGALVLTRENALVLFPVAAAQRLFDRWLGRGRHAEPKSFMSQQGKALNASLIALHEIERTVVFPFNRLAGLTAYCVARRPDGERAG